MSGTLCLGGYHYFETQPGPDGRGLIYEGQVCTCGQAKMKVIAEDEVLIVENKEVCKCLRN